MAPTHHRPIPRVVGAAPGSLCSGPRMSSICISGRSLASTPPVCCWSRETSDPPPPRATSVRAPWQRPPHSSPIATLPSADEPDSCAEPRRRRGEEEGEAGWRCGEEKVGVDNFVEWKSRRCYTDSFVKATDSHAALRASNFNSYVKHSINYKHCSS